MGQKSKEKKDGEEEVPATPSGEFVFPNKDRYKGEFQVNEEGTIVRHGVGTHTTVGGIVFSGTWSHDKLNGNGRVEFPSGAKYEGEMRDSKYDGMGAYTWPNGCVYKGEFVESKLQGNGVFNDHHGQPWVGEFRYKAAPGLKFQLNM
uniref:MORN repeat-containing protein 2-like n=1 Tax=Ciona intestinalis TaxID=7719 RepID=UPI0002B8E0B4|nr:MORN repeat-containing protein 2-like [Ciona intestinalis]|eukprot:XP_004227382.1 MORN repeat-containing protein 2-like [Ciona intestinalis]